MTGPRLMTIPYGISEESRASPRYDWNGERRAGGPFVILQQTLDGEGAFDFGGVTYPVRAGQAFIAFVPERSRYYYPPHATKPWVFRWINFYGDFAVDLWREFRASFGPVPMLILGSPAERQLAELIELVVRARQHDPFEAGELAYQFYLRWWQQLQLRQPPDFADPIREAEKFCRQHFRRRLAVKEVAAHVGMSREHFTRLFRERFHSGPGEYLRTLRLKEARRLRRTTGLPLKEIALRTGFPSARQMSVWLRT